MVASEGLAQGMETVAKNAKEIAQQDGASNSESVHRVTPPTRGKDTGRNRPKFTGICFCCGRVGHKRENCRLKEAICHGCGRIGHIQRVCRSKSATKSKNKPVGKRPVHHLEESPEESSDDSSGDYDLYSITSSSKSYRVNIAINDKSTKMETDTAASLTIMSERTLREQWPELTVLPSRVKLHSYSGEAIPVLGTVDVMVIRQPHYPC